MKLLALHQGLKLVVDHHHRPIEIETDSTEVIQLLEQQNPIYQILIDSCRCLLKRLGNPVVRHNFRAANNVSYLLAKEDSKQTMRNQLSVFLQPPTPVWTSLQADKEAVTTKKIVSVSMYNNLARLET